MLNVHDLALKITNYKMYKSPYNKNIIQVFDDIKKYEFRVRLNFFNNLKNLTIDKVDELNNNFNISGMYNINKNQIYVVDCFDEVQLNTTVNHELFHVASTNKKNSKCGIKEGGCLSGEMLNEGITEYFSLKSLGINISFSNYQLELFVIQFLVFVFGEQILEPYFNSGSKTFFNQFKQRDIVIEIDILLFKIKVNEECQMYRLLLLIFSDIFPDMFDKDIEYFKKMGLNLFQCSEIKKILEKYYDKIKVKLNKNINIDEYVFDDLEKKEIYENYIYDYKKRQEINVEKIFSWLIFIAELNDVLFEDVVKFVNDCLVYKSDSFKGLYSKTIKKSMNNYR